MRAMILAAGLGKRMRPLTDNLPKPLLKAGKKTLIEHQIDRLVAGGITGAVINHFYLGGLIEQALGDGSRFGLDLSYSREPILLDTAGGIIKCLPMLKDDSFIVVNSDVWTDFDFSTLQPVNGEQRLAHLVLVDNAEHNPAGDFHLNGEGLVRNGQAGDGSSLTFSGISVMHRNLFKGFPIQPRSVVPLLQEAMRKDQVSGEHFQGEWIDVGTPERLADVNTKLAEKPAEQESDA